MNVEYGSLNLRPVKKRVRQLQSDLTEFFGPETDKRTIDLTFLLRRTMLSLYGGRKKEGEGEMEMEMETAGGVTTFAR
jgi:hypothetical protein